MTAGIDGLSTRLAVKVIPELIARLIAGLAVEWIAGFAKLIAVQHRQNHPPTQLKNIDIIVEKAPMKRRCLDMGIAKITE